MTFLGRRVPSSFAHRVVTIAGGTDHPYEAVEWRDAIVVVEAGEVELEAIDGERHLFRRGDLLWLHRVSLRSIHNHGLDDAVLVAIARQTGDTPR